MKYKLTKTAWEQIGKQTGWLREAIGSQISEWFKTTIYNGLPPEAKDTWDNKLDDHGREWVLQEIEKRGTQFEEAASAIPLVGNFIGKAVGNIAGQGAEAVDQLSALQDPKQLQTIQEGGDSMPADWGDIKGVLETVNNQTSETEKVVLDRINDLEKNLSSMLGQIPAQGGQAAARR